MAERRIPGFPRRGEIYWVDFNPRRGSEQAGVRPAVVVSDDALNQHGPTAIVAAVTRTIPSKDYPQNVHLPADRPLREAGTILCAQLLTISKTRLKSLMGRLDDSQLAELDRALWISVGLRGVGRSREEGEKERQNPEDQPSQ